MVAAAAFGPSGDLPAEHVPDNLDLVDLGAVLQRFQHPVRQPCAEQGLHRGHRKEVVDAARWMIEKLRVILFARTLGMPSPGSERRIRAAIERLR
jgi:hypothetical protein